MSLGGLSFQMGPTGFLSWLIPTILVACGMLMWFSPQQRMFYSIVGAMTAVFSLIAVNLGGFFIGMVLGMLGGALGFGWVPVPGRGPAAAPDAPAGEAEGADRTAGPGEAAADPGEPGDPGAVAPVPADAAADPGEAAGYDDAYLPGRWVDDTGERPDGPLTDTLPQPRNPLREPAQPPSAGRWPGHQKAADPDSATSAENRDGRAGADRPDERTTPGADGEAPRRGPSLFVVTLLLLGFTSAGVLALGGGVPAQAAPCPTARPTSSATATPTPGSPSASPTAPAGKQDDGSLLGNVVGGIVDGLHDLFGGGDKPAVAPGPAPAAAPASAAAPTPDGVARPAGGPTPGGRPAPGACAPGRPVAPKPGRSGPVPLVDPPAGQPAVNKVPSLMTGTKVTMYDLRLEGIAELPLQGGGTIRALEFGMSKAVTDDFALRAPGPAGRSQLLRTSVLTVDGDVHFYASRFEGKLAGIPIVLTPEQPLPPDGIPLTLPTPVTFGDPKVQLVFVDCNTLTAPDLVHTLV
jgi:hypothetical protein